MGAYYSYTDFKRDRLNFVKVDRTGPGRYDMPNNVYFKIAFYFTDDNGLLGSSYDILLKGSGKDEAHTKMSNLSAPFNDTSNLDSKIATEQNSSTSVLNRNNVGANSAYNFLILNNELERAKLLKQFITLLSEISSNSPWYFNSISGLDTALERKYFGGEEFKLEEKPNQITIKCLNDAVDNRIGVLLDLYRTICFSYRNKKEIIPANLRKFNMGILIFGRPLRGHFTDTNGTNAKNESIEIPSSANESYYIPNVKLIELQNCELDYNSAKTGYQELSNDDANYQQYTITINYDNAYESRYNEQLQEVISDFINIDLGIEDGNRTLDGIFSDIDRNGTQVDDTKSLKVYNVVEKKDDDGNVVLDQNGTTEYDYKTTGKGYWTNTDWEQSGNYEVRYEKVAKREINDVNGSFLSTQYNNLSSKVSSVLAIPELNVSKENITRNGTQNTFGKYQYLNFMSNSDSLLGSAVNLVGGKAVNGVVQAAKNIYLGNIHNNSLSDISRSISNAINGNYQNIAQNKTNNSQESTKGEDISNKRLWEKQKVSSRAKFSKAQSLYNNI